MRYLLDTCLISEALKRSPEKKVLEWLQAQEEDGLFLSVITMGEIQKGISKLPEGTRRRRIRKWLDHDLSRRFISRILPIDQAVASRWGSICGEAERIGRKIPVLDALLAATALEAGLTLATRNTRDLQATGVPILDPWAF